MAAVPAAIAAGCGHGHLLPSGAANVDPGAPAVAVAEAGGVELSADADSWAGKPDDLPGRLTPVKVRIINHSGRPVELLYERFALAGGHGRTYRPLPPFPVENQTALAHAGAVTPIFAAERFYVAQRLQAVYPSLTPWSRPISRQEGFCARQYGRWPEALPTHEMQRLGLPEGVLGDGGEISGYLFFEDATRRDSRVTLKADLEDGGGAVAAIEIPFRVE